jgi:hypothetical protein
MTHFHPGRKATHKFGAVRTERAGIKFDSKAEADYHDVLQLAAQAGDLVGLMRQPVFYLPGGTRYVADFLCFWADGRVDTRDVKGMETEGFGIKWREVQAAYPFMTFVKVKRSGKGWKEEA